jgi:arsenate reductase
LLNESGAEHVYREYTEDPLSEQELKEVFTALDMRPRDLLRMRDAKPLGVTGDEPDNTLIQLMAQNPTLLQRPIGVSGSGENKRAVVGRPPENLLDLL